MAKRVVTKIGDVFCVDFRNGKKGYFQYVAKDMTQLNSSVIRAFYTHYPIDQQVPIEEIVRDKVAFYAHAILRSGIDFGFWEKVGKSKDIGEKKVRKVMFGSLYDSFNKNWLKIWRINGIKLCIGFLWRLWKFKLEQGAVFSMGFIVYRMFSGYYNFSTAFWEISKRQPRPEYRSYVELVEAGTKYFLCYIGEELDRCMVIKDKKVKIYSTEEAKAAQLEIADKKFSDTNWGYGNFLTVAEFKERWDNAELYLQSGDPEKIRLIEEVSIKPTEPGREFDFFK